MELAHGDESRIGEIKQWLKEGTKIAQVRERLEELGYSPYHISFLLERSTGQKFIPSKPEVLIDRKKIRIAMTVATLVLLILVIAVFFPGVIPW